MEVLTRRELWVLGQVLAGRTQQQMAGDLGYRDKKSVQAPLRSAQEKLGTRSHVHSALVALKLGLIRRPPIRAGKYVRDLTERERKVLTLVGCGFNGPEIAEILGFGKWVFDDVSRNIRQAVGLELGGGGGGDQARLFLVAERYRQVSLGDVEVPG